MSETPTPDEASETPFEKAMGLLQLQLDTPGGFRPQTTTDQLLLIQTLMMADLHNQMILNRQVLETIAERLSKED